MRIIRDSDTVEYIDGSGDKLVLLSAPRQRDVQCSDEIERDDAMEQLNRIKQMGVDTDAIMADAEKDPEALTQAQEAAKDSPAPPKVREFRLKALAIRLVVGGESFGGEAIVASYRDMDPESAAWVDATIAEVWKAAQPSEADTRGAGADVAVPVCAPVSTPA